MSKAMKGDGKKTLVPKLRFREFQDIEGWSVKRLGKLARKITAKNHGCRHTRVLTNSAEHGVVDQRDYFDKDIANSKNIGNYCIVEQGDYVYNPRVSTSAPVGPISRNNLGAGVMSPLYTVFRFDTATNEFFSHYFKSSRWHSYLQTVSNTGARFDRMAISSSDFMAMPLPCPLLREQQKIADCLSSLDALITAHTDKLAALKTHKQGLLQQLFPRDGETVPRLRFPEFRNAGEWQEMTLSSQIELVSGQHLAADAYADMGEIPYFTGPSDYSNALNEVTKWTARSKNTARCGDILVTVKGSGVGELLYLELAEVAMGRQLMAVRPREVLGGNFLFQFLATQQVRLGALAAGNLIPGLSRSDLLTLAIRVPSAAEQARIGDCIASLDTLIAAQTDRIEALQQHKQGLLQQLFPAMDAAIA